MSPKLRSPALPYAVAVLAAAAALLVRWPLWPLLGNSLPYITFFPAVMLAAHVGGWRPGLLATALGAAGTVYFLIEPRYSFEILTVADAAGVTLFVAVGAVLSALCEALRRARRRAEESEARFAAVVNHSPAAIFVKDARGRYLLANRTVADLVGCRPADFVGRTDADFLGPEVAARFGRDDAEVLASGRPRVYEESFPFKGATLTFLTVKFPLLGPDGRPRAVCGIATDVTARKQAEAALRQTEEVLRLLAETGELLASSPDYEATLASVARLAVPRVADWCSVYVPDEKGAPRQLAVAHIDPAKVERAREANRRWPPDPDAPRGVAAVLRTGQPELAPEITEEMLRLAARDAEHLEMLRGLGVRSVMMVPLTARGRTLGVMNFVAAESGRRYGPEDLAVAEDLARRAALAVDNARLYREAQGAARRLSLLVEASARLTSSLELPAVQAAVLELSNRLIAADAYAIWRQQADSGAWEVAQSAGLSETYLRTAGRVPATNTAMPRDPVVAEDAQGTAFLESRRQAYRAEGIASLLSVPLLIHGQVAGTLVFYYRSRRPFDETTLRVATALANLAGSALGTAELYERESASRRRAEEADRRKDEFLALLGHELRNPLAPIRNAVDLLALRPGDPALVAQARDIVGRQIAQLTRLVDELLDASRVSRGKVQLKSERLDLAALVRTTAEDHRPELEAAGLALGVEVPEGSLWVAGDGARLRQVLGNLLHNALKFTDRGGRVTVRLARQDGRAALAVEDTGVGLRPEVLPSLFQAFSQAEATLDRTKGGLGLGLSVVKGLVELHGGEVRAASEGPGRGATFTAWLPLDGAGAGPSG